MTVEARVYSTHKGMMAGIRGDHAKGGQSGAGNDTKALTCTDTRLIKVGRGAVIYFNRKHLSHGIIAHEMDHAAFGMMARRKVKQIKCDAEGAAEHEETHAYLVQDLVEGFYKKCAVT